MARLYQWIQAISLIKEKPIIGYGPGNVALFGEILIREVKYYSPHNIIFEVLIHSGLIGFTMFVIVIISLLKRALFVFKINGDSIFIVLLFAMLLNSMFEPTLSGYEYSFLFWSFMGILFVSSKNNNLKTGY